MAVVKTLNGTKLLVQVGDGGGPEVFTHPCLINAERGIQFTSSTNDQVIPDCTTPDDAAWVTRTKDALSASVSGAGILNTSDTETFWDWFKNDTAKNVRVNVNTTGALGGGYWAFSAKLTEFGVSGTRGEKATCDLTIVSDGVVAWTDNA